MKKIISLITGVLLAASWGHSAENESVRHQMLTAIDQSIEKGSFKPTWESLSKHIDPEWFQDAKFGIYTHWGPVTVGSTGGGSQWYGKAMYEPGNKTFNYHRQHFGDQNKVGFKDLIPKLTAQKFNADEWADLFARSGAKFAGPVAVHHDNFMMWDSKLTRWTSVNMGPHRDITGELEKAIRARGMKFITTFHHGFAWRYFEPAFKYDAADPQYADLYTEIHEPNAPPSKAFQDQWLALVYEVLGKYQPDLIWFDFEFFRVIQPAYQQKLFAMTYNWANENNRTIGVCQKSPEIRNYTGIFDIERGRENSIKPYVWLTDSMVSDWFYRESSEAKSLHKLISMLVDIVSKNGCLLLDVGPTVDGTIPDKDRDALLGMGAWLKINGEAIYATRPWKIYGEGPTRLAKSGTFGEDAEKPYGAQDIRFTQSKDGKTLYATALGVPENRQIQVKSLSAAAGKISRVELLGHTGALEWKQTDEALVVTLPATGTYQNAISLKIHAGELNPVSVIYDTSIKANESGNIELSATAAEIHTADKHTPEAKKPLIGSWTDPKDFVSWECTIEYPGTYEVDVTYSCATQPGSAFYVEMDRQKLDGKTASTGMLTYRTDHLGVLYVEKPGLHTINFKAKAEPEWHGIGLSTIVLKRIM
ncbi:MAG TPA: alpha-L-fucosidase [Pontiellaceae bacterium]|nr:alpha-L-fucosidase [Pontiellaceae bacterium]